MGYVLFQDASFWSVTVGSEPELDDRDALLTAYSPGLDKLSLPHLSSSVPALLAGLFQLPAHVIVVCPIINPAFGSGWCRFSMPHRMVAGHSGFPGETIRDICMTLSLPADAVVGKDGSSQGNTKRRIRLLGSRGNSPCEFRPSVPEKVLGGTALSSNHSMVNSRSLSGNRQTIDRCSVLFRRLFGIPKKGGRLTELYLDDYALKNGA